MDYNSGPSGYGDDSYHRYLQDEQLPASDYVVENVDDRRNGGASAVDTGGMQMTQSSDHLHSSSSMSSPGKLFVGGVSWETTEETFAKYFEKFGEVVDSVIMRDRMTGKPRGFGFVTFAYSDVEENVLEEEHVIDDCKFLEDTGIVTSNRYQKLGKSLCGGLPPFLEEVVIAILGDQVSEVLWSLDGVSSRVFSYILLGVAFGYVPSTLKLLGPPCGDLW
ncbi:hypothetical protein Bca4012_010077 [Brassica carinata]